MALEKRLEESQTYRNPTLYQSIKMDSGEELNVIYLPFQAISK